MRKLSILALVVILASALSVAGFATTQQGVNTAVEVDQFLSLDIKEGSTVDFGTIDPTSTHNEIGATKLKVKSNPNESWEITTNMSDDVTDYDLASKLTVSPTSSDEGGTYSSAYGSFEGSGTTNNIYVDYHLGTTEGIPSGLHNVTVTFTVAYSE